MSNDSNYGTGSSSKTVNVKFVHYLDDGGTTTFHFLEI